MSPSLLAPTIEAFYNLANAELVQITHRDLAVSEDELLDSWDALNATQEPADYANSRSGDGTLILTPVTLRTVRVPAILYVVETGRDDPPAEITFAIAGSFKATGGLENGAADIPIVTSAHAISVTAKIGDPGKKASFLVIPAATRVNGDYTPAAMELYWDGSTAAAHATITTTVSGAPTGSIIRAYAITPGSRYYRAVYNYLAHGGKSPTMRSSLARRVDSGARPKGMLANFGFGR